jgi:hypothetical protein
MMALLPNREPVFERRGKPENQALIMSRGHIAGQPSGIQPGDKDLLEVFVDAGHDFATTIETIRADVMATMGLTTGGIHRDGWLGQCIMRAAHSASGWGFTTFLNGHMNLLSSA